MDPLTLKAGIDVLGLLSTYGIPAATAAAAIAGSSRWTKKDYKKKDPGVLKKRPRKRPAVKSCAALERKVARLCKRVESSRATHDHRSRGTGRCLATVNAAVYTSYNYPISALETACANLRYFDAATNALVVADPSTGTYSNDITVLYIVNKIHVVNNYQVPVDVTVCGLRPKYDTSISALTYYTDGLTDQGNPSAVSPMLSLKDSEIMKEMWEIKKSKKKMLMPGQSIDLSIFIPSFEYDFSQADSHNLFYQKKYNGLQWVIRTTGCLGHDSTADEQGSMLGGIDYRVDAHYKFEYDAGKDLADLSVTDSSNTFTNGGLVSSKPVADNIGYSLS